MMKFYVDGIDLDLFVKIVKEINKIFVEILYVSWIDENYKWNNNVY